MSRPASTCRRRGGPTISMVCRQVEHSGRAMSLYLPRPPQGPLGRAMGGGLDATRQSAWYVVKWNQRASSLPDHSGDLLMILCGQCRIQGVRHSFGVAEVAHILILCLNKTGGARACIADPFVRAKGYERLRYVHRTPKGASSRSYLPTRKVGCCRVGVNPTKRIFRRGRAV